MRLITNVLQLTSCRKTNSELNQHYEIDHVHLDDCPKNVIKHINSLFKFIKSMSLKDNIWKLRSFGS